jgi:hypothetical protein
VFAIGGKKFALPDAGRNSGTVFGNQLEFSAGVFSIQFSVFRWHPAANAD